MGWPKGWKRQDIGPLPGATDGKQHVYIDGEVIRTYGPAVVPVKVISILLAAMQEEPETSMWDAHMVEWTESERGWGQRPDGASLHATAEDAKKYIADYWEREKERNPSGETPDEYSRPDSDGFPVLVSKDVFDKIKASDNGIRLWRSRVSELEQQGELTRPK